MSTLISSAWTDSFKAAVAELKDTEDEFSSTREALLEKDVAKIFSSLKKKVSFPLSLD